MGVRSSGFILKKRLRCHLFIPLWLPRNERRRRQNIIQQRMVSDYLCRYLPAADNFAENYVPGPGKDSGKVFSIWLQGEESAPPIVRACIESARKQFGERYVLLDARNLADYVTLPDYIEEKFRKGKIKPAHYADICRVELLYRYGGYWLDTTCYVTSAIPQEISSQDFFMFTVGDIGAKYGYSFVQNCFIRSTTGSFLLGAWRAMIHAYWKDEDCTADYFVHQLLFMTLVQKNSKAAGIYADIPKITHGATHCLWWAWADKPYDRETFRRLTCDAFFQKTTYKDPNAQNPVQGSFADHMINGGI